MFTRSAVFSLSSAFLLTEATLYPLLAKACATLCPMLGPAPSRRRTLDELAITQMSYVLQETKCWYE